MRSLTFALLAAVVTVPASVVAYDDASAQRGREYRDRDQDFREWRGRDGRTYCRRPNGTTGLVVGGVAGALVGRTIDSRGDRTLGTLLGGAAGALAGREIERGGSRRCQ